MISGKGMHNDKSAYILTKCWIVQQKLDDFWYMYTLFVLMQGSVSRLNEKTQCVYSALHNNNLIYYSMNSEKWTLFTSNTHSCTRKHKKIKLILHVTWYFKLALMWFTAFHILLRQAYCLTSSSVKKWITKWNRCWIVKKRSLMVQYIGCAKSKNASLDMAPVYNNTSSFKHLTKERCCLLWYLFYNT